MTVKLLIEGTNEADDYWVELTYAVTQAMKQITKGRPYPTHWVAEVSNFGWRGLSGGKRFKAENGEQLLLAILPNTPCSFKIYLDKERKVISINNAHHDKPMGGEWYYIRPATTREVEGSYSWK